MNELTSNFLMHFFLFLFIYKSDGAFRKMYTAPVLNTYKIAGNEHKYGGERCIFCKSANSVN